MTKHAVGRIVVHPIKSLDGVAVSEAKVLGSGALEHDREFALFDREGNWINGKRDSWIHSIRSEFDLSSYVVTLNSDRGRPPQQFHLLEDQQRLGEWFTDFFGYEIVIKRDAERGFPDDTDSPGPTFISAATLRTVSSWFNITDPNETLRRFRANIQIEGDVAFWEDRLFGAAGEIVEFQVGDVTVHGVNPCQRCPVPSRNPATGAAIHNFQKIFSAKRAAELPGWANASRFNHFYRLAVNTRIPPSEAGKRIRIGDLVEIGQNHD
jgi:uncharacterized protein YcbX